MDKKKRVLLVLLFAAAAGVIAWAVMTVPAPRQQEEQTSDSQVMTYDGNTISETKDGRKIWELTADHIEVDVNSQDARLENVVGHFYMADGRTVEVKADTGSYERAVGDINVKGNVAITTSDGAKLASDELKWTGQESVLAAIGNATASKDDMKANGDRIESADGFNKIRIIGNAHLVKGGEAK